MELLVFIAVFYTSDLVINVARKCSCIELALYDFVTNSMQRVCLPLLYVYCISHYINFILSVSTSRKISLFFYTIIEV